MSVYRNLVVEIPKKHVTVEKQRDGKPALVKYVIEAPYDREKGYSRPKRTTIGHQCLDSATTMHPTTQYAEIFPDLWEQISSEPIKPSVIKIGMFSACQAINKKTGIKNILDNVYGVNHANALMDYAMYSVIYHSDVTSSFESKMSNERLYSKQPCKDSYYSRLFETGMTMELELLFKRKWALHCKDEGIDSVWLCIDGSNDDCQSKGVEIAEKGHSKSRKNNNIVSFTYAITPEGKPVTYDVYRGGLVDAKALQSILDFLRECGIQVSGVILDRGYCNSKAIQYLDEHGIKYVIMVKGAPDGFGKMAKENAQNIKMNMDYLVPYTYLFACQQSVQLFKCYNHKDYLTLFFDYQNGAERITALLKNIYDEMLRLQNCMKKGEEPVVDSKYSKILSVDESAENCININTAELQSIADKKGLYGIVSSVEMSPKEIHDLYASRSASETQYRLVKTQLGYGTIRVHYTAGVRARFAVAFIASILRYEIKNAADKLDRSTNQMIHELEKLEARKINGVYAYTHTENNRTKAFFNFLQSDAAELLEKTVRLENDRIAGRIPTPRRRKTGPKKGSHRKVYDDQGNVIPRKPGVKKGTKRKDINKDGTPRKKPGVKSGTKRGTYNKDGSVRKKPGPKPKADTN